MEADFQQQVKLWARERGLLGASTPADQLTKLGEEFGELATAIAKGDECGLIDAVGDMQVVLAVMCAMRGYDVDSCRDIAMKQVKNRKGKVVNGVFVKESPRGEVAS